MTTIHFVGTPPTITRLDNSPRPPRSRERPLPSPHADVPRYIVMRVSETAWIDNNGSSEIPSTVRDLSYHLEKGTPYIPITLPPAGSAPELRELKFSNLPIKKIQDIGNIDEYCPTLERITLQICPSLVIPDFSWFAQLPSIKSIWITNCNITSLAHLDEIARVIQISIPGNGLELSNEIGVIESYWQSHGAGSTKAGYFRIGRNLINGRVVRKLHRMTTASTIGYIRGWMMRR